MNKVCEYHLSYSQPSEHWPDGCWALYEITGDEIAKRITYDGYGIVRSRDSWCGFIGCFASLELATAAIEKAMSDK